LVGTALDTVAEMDLGASYASYRADGHCQPAYEPSIWWCPCSYAYARGNRSSRARVEDAAYRVVGANLVPITRRPRSFVCGTRRRSPSSPRA
jgi:hypothetical protein